ncbi:PREDICTED: sugar transporter SWEET1-like [Acropora digitifera]|uniref:sugar transporter SWEET1-like n=1 Tax=Acropora digitifera TaxID=70779 RepID=UPI00077B083C|nr:PREDICTED: sugar transporter SWEET1-like [Acropora digitifera]
MDIKHIVSWSATLSQFGLLSTGISVCLKIRQQGSTKNITSFPFFTTCLSSILWTKYGILTNDTALCVVGVAGIVLQSIYLLFYYLNTRKKVSSSNNIYTCSKYILNEFFPWIQKNLLLLVT